MPTSHTAPVVVVAPDSFKGSLSAQQVGDAIAAGLRRAWPKADIRIRPLADGGEGTLDAMLANGGKRVKLHVRNAAGAPREALTGLLPDQAAIVETAEIVGITDPVGMAIPIEKRSTLGLGDAIRTHLDQGARRILIALGGSSTNDGGAGLLNALGLRFLDADGEPLPPSPDAFERIVEIDVSGLDSRLRGCSLLAMTDVDNLYAGSMAQAPSSVRRRARARNKSRYSIVRCPISPICSKRRSANGSATCRARAPRAASDLRCTRSARGSNRARKSSRPRPASTKRSRARIG